MSRVDDASADAVQTLGAFIAVYKAAAIPAMIGACVLWTVENGAPDLIKGTLRNALKLTDTMNAAHRKAAQ